MLLVLSQWQYLLERHTARCGSAGRSLRRGLRGAGWWRLHVASPVHGARRRRWRRGGRRVWRGRRRHRGVALITYSLLNTRPQCALNGRYWRRYKARTQHHCLLRKRLSCCHICSNQLLIMQPPSCQSISDCQAIKLHIRQKYLMQSELLTLPHQLFVERCGIRH